MKVAVVLPVWQESRYLPLVLEQMLLCPGPKIALFQDKPLYWLGEGEPISGFASRVSEILEQFPEIEVIKMEHAPMDSEERFGGFAALAKGAIARLRKEQIDVMTWADSDWLFSLSDMAALYETIVASDRVTYWSVPTQHYWRSFRETYATTPITFGYPTNIEDLWGHVEEDKIVRTAFQAYHPSYVLTDAEVYIKVNSWGHAPLFKENGFYENWKANNDAAIGGIQVKPAAVRLPNDVVSRLKKWNSVLPEWL